MNNRTLKPFLEDIIEGFRNFDKRILVLLVVYFVQGMINNLGHPVTPILITSTGIPNEMFGYFFSMMSLGLVIGGPIWGILGDTWRKETFVLIGLLIYSAGQILFGFVDDMYWKVAFRFMSGFGVSAAITLMLSHLIVISADNERAKNIARSVALMGLGSSVGYLLGGEMNSSALMIRLFRTDLYQNIFLIQGILNAILAVSLFFILRAQVVKEVKVETAVKERKSFLSGFKHVKDLSPNLILFMFSITLISIGAINVGKYLEVYFNELGYNPDFIGRYVFITGIVAILTNIFLVPLILKIQRDFKVMIFTQIISAIIIFVIFRLPNLLLMLYTVFMFYVVLKAVFAPLEQNYISKHAKGGRYGTMMGIRQSFFSIGMVIGPLIGGYLYSIEPLYVFDFSALMFLFGFLLLLFLEKKVKRELRDLKVNS
ncbi:MAG: MFS transporter [Candidatus Izemoplasmataceae bacterium]